jgi:uncharacterized protein YyaL (SSP411 family)
MALLELFKATGRGTYADAARRNVEFAIANQKANGWFRNCAFVGGTHPSTHTIAYTIEGILECGVILKEESYVEAATRTADALLSVFEKKHSFSGTYDENWSSKDRYSCLTGDAQISVALMRLFEIKKRARYQEDAKELNSHLKRVQSRYLASTEWHIRGAIPGSDPIWGKYNPFSFLSWSTKFFVDALLHEERL